MDLPRWRGVIRSVAPGLLIFLLAPLLIILLFQGPAIYGIKLDVNVLLALILLFQLYVIAIQVEITLRQNALFYAQYEPALKVNVSSSSASQWDATPKYTSISLKNISDKPAFSVMIGLVDRGTGKAIEESARLDRGIPSLGPGDSMDVLQMPSKDYYDKDIDMNILYTNVLGDMSEVTFTKSPKSDNFFLIRPMPRIGILLPSLEKMGLIWRFLTWEKRARKIRTLRAKSRQNTRRQQEI